MPPNEALEGGRRACFIYSTRGYTLLIHYTEYEYDIVYIMNML